MKDLKLEFLFQTVVSFLFISFLSLLTADNMTGGKVFYAQKPAQSVYISSAFSPYNNFSQMDTLQFLASFFIATLLMLFFLKLFKGKFLFEIFFSGAMIFGAQGPLGIIFSRFSSFLLAIGIVILRFIYPRIWTQNFAIILGISGIAAVLGMSVKSDVVIILLILLSFYDIIAVYKTRHMVALFKEMAQRGAVLALIVPKNFHFWAKKFDIIKKKDKEEFIFIGTGDLALPALFAVSAFPAGIKFSLAIIFGAAVGFFVDHMIFINQKKEKPIPALPSLAFFSIIAYFVSFYI